MKLQAKGTILSCFVPAALVSPLSHRFLYLTSLPHSSAFKLCLAYPWQGLLRDLCPSSDNYKSQLSTGPQFCGPIQNLELPLNMSSCIFKPTIIHFQSGYNRSQSFTLKLPASVLHFQKKILFHLLHRELLLSKCVFSMLVILQVQY